MVRQHQKLEDEAEESAPPETPSEYVQENLNDEEKMIELLNLAIFSDDISTILRLIKEGIFEPEEILLGICQISQNT